MALGLSLNLMASAVRRAGRALIQRYFHDLDAAAQQYYALSEPVTLSGDFEIEAEFAVTLNGNPSTLYSITGGGAVGSTKPALIYIGGDGKIYGGFGNGSTNYTISSSAGSVTSDKLYTANLKSVGGTLSLILGGAVVATTAASGAPASPTNYVGVHFALNHFAGIIPSLKIWTGGDRTTGTLAHRWDFNTDLSSPVVPDLVGGNHATAVNMTSADAWRGTQVGSDWLGDEAILNGGFDDASNWSIGATLWQITGGKAIYTTPAPSNQALTQFSVITPGVHYRVSYDLTVASGAFVAYLGTGGTGITRNSSGSYTETITAGTSANVFAFALTGFTGDLDNYSARRLLETAP